MHIPLFTVGATREGREEYPGHDRPPVRREPRGLLPERVQLVSGARVRGQYYDIVIPTIRVLVHSALHDSQTVSLSL